jgi:hypothetical protein
MSRLKRKDPFGPLAATAVSVENTAQDIRSRGTMQQAYFIAAIFLRALCCIHCNSRFRTTTNPDKARE